MKRAIGYVRVSTGGQEAGTSLKTQREQIKAYAQERGFELVAVVEETASGGIRGDEEFSFEHRPRLVEIIERSKEKPRPFDAVIVARLDRLSRDYATLTVLERRLQRRGVAVLSVSEENGDGATARMVRGMLAVIADYEREVIRLRISAGKAARNREGKFEGGRPPFGYELAPKRAGHDAGRLMVVPKHRPTVKRIFERAKEGESPARIARDLTTDRIPGPSGKGWSRQAVTLILRNPAYTGERAGVRDAQPALITRRMFLAVQRALDARRRSY